MGWFWWWPFGKVPEVSARQLDSLLRHRASAPQLVDVRTRTEWRAGYIAGAIHVPISSLDARVPALQLDGARPVVAICRSAHRSVPAVRILHTHVFGTACQLQGGMLAWLDAGLPVVIDADREEG
jgi:rhodanese-related sulfurtransferase